MTEVDMKDVIDAYVQFNTCFKKVEGELKKIAIEYRDAHRKVFNDLYLGIIHNQPENGTQYQWVLYGNDVRIRVYDHVAIEYWDSDYTNKDSAILKRLVVTKDFLDPVYRQKMVDVWRDNEQQMSTSYAANNRNFLQAKIRKLQKELDDMDRIGV